MSGELNDLQRAVIDALARKWFPNRAALAAEVGRTESSINQVLPVLRRRGIITRRLSVKNCYNPLRKFFIFIETRAPGNEDANYQSNLVHTILKEEKEHKHADVIIENIEIVMGADWDIILTVRAREPQYVYDFVVTYLRPKSAIARTRTASVFIPKPDNMTEEPISPDLPGLGDESKEAEGGESP